MNTERTPHSHRGVERSRSASEPVRPHRSTRHNLNRDSATLNTIPVTSHYSSECGEESLTHNRTFRPARPGSSTSTRRHYAPLVAGSSPLPLAQLRRRPAPSAPAAGGQRQAGRVRLRRRPVGRRPGRRRRPPADRRGRAGDLPGLLARTASRSPSPASTRATSTSTSSRPPAACPAG